MVKGLILLVLFVLLVIVILIGKRVNKSDWYAGGDEDRERTREKFSDVLSRRGEDYPHHVRDKHRK